jgi:hypothetical protein
MENKIKNRILKDFHLFSVQLIFLAYAILEKRSSWEADTDEDI